MRRTLTTTLLLLLVGAGVVAGSRWMKPEAREVTTSSTEAYEAYRKGLSETSRFRLEAAHENFAKAVELDPDFAVARVRLALASRELGRHDEYRNELVAAFESRENASEIEALWIARVYAVTNGEHSRGMELYEEMKEKYPNHPWVLRLKAEFAKMNNRFDEALEAYDGILAQNPEAVDMHNLKGYLYLSQGDYERAIQSLERYAYYAPDQANPHDSLGEAYMYSGHYEDAILEFRRALEIDPSFAWSGVHLSEVLAITGQFENSRGVLDVVKPIFEERDWSNWFAMQRMKVDYMAERWDSLVQETETRLPIDPDALKPMEFEYAVWVHYARTSAYLGLGDIESAGEAVQGLIGLIERARKEGESYRDMDPIIELNRAFLMSRFARAENEPEREIETLRKAIDAATLSPHQQVDFRRELIEALLDAGRPAEATAEASIVLEVIPTQPDVNLLAARAHRDNGDRDQALTHLSTYLEVMRFADDGHPRVAEARRLLDRMLPRS